MVTPRGRSAGTIRSLGARGSAQAELRRPEFSVGKKEVVLQPVTSGAPGLTVGWRSVQALRAVSTGRDLASQGQGGPSSGDHSPAHHMARATTQRSAEGGRSTTARPGSSYSFHGLYSVRVAHAGLQALMARELGDFRSEVDVPDLMIEEGTIPQPANSLLEHYRYDESAFVFETESGRIAVRKGGIVAEPGVKPIELLGAWVENLMKPAILRRGVCFVHASAISRDGSACLFPAWMGTGKTLVLLHALAQGYDYMADDWCFVSESGEALGYPRWPTLKYDHFKAYPALRDIVARGPGRGDLGRRLRVGDYVDSLRPSGYLARRFHRMLSDRFHVSVQASPTEIFPSARSISRSPVRRVALLISSDRPGVEVRRIPPEEAARRTILSGRFEREPHDAHWVAAAYAGHGATLRDTTEEETELLSRALREARCFEVMLPDDPHQRDLDRILSEIV